MKTAAAVYWTGGACVDGKECERPRLPHTPDADMAFAHSLSQNMRACDSSQAAS